MVLQMALFPFLWLSNIPLCIHHMHTHALTHTRTHTHTHTHTHITSHPPVGGQLGCFHVLAIADSAAMNTGVSVSF